MFLKRNFLILSVINFVFLYFIFFSNLTVTNLDKKNEPCFSKEPEYIKIFGHIYNLKIIKNNFLHLFKNYSPISNSSALKSKIKFLLFHNKAILLDQKIFQSNNYQISLFTYGLESHFFSSLIELIESNKLPCEITVTSTQLSSETIPAAVYIRWENFIFQISIFYPRGNFFWIPADNYQLENREKILNDHPRALNRFQTKAVRKDNENYIVPIDYGQFEYDLDRSKFIECNFELAKSSSFKSPQNKVKNIFFFYRLFYIKEILESNKKDYWLSAGTLLGWYRDCGIIPHTTDGDIGLLAHQYDFDLEQAFLHSKKVPLIKKLGFVNDSLEFRVGDEDFPIDLFFNYIYNQTHMMYSIQAIRKVYRIFLTRVKYLCSAELLEEKFFVPCNPNLMLDQIYGKNLWIRLKNNNKMSPTILLWKRWSLVEWKNAVKFYDNGTFLKNYTWNYIRPHI